MIGEYNTPSGVKKLVGFVGIPLVILVMVIVFCPLVIGINDAGHRTVIQYPNGSLTVKFDPGWYWQFFGKIT